MLEFIGFLAMPLIVMALFYMLGCPVPLNFTSYLCSLGLLLLFRLRNE